MSRNSDGDPCPPWCVTDHAEYGFHAAERVIIYAPQFRPCRIRAIRYASDIWPQVQIAADGMFSVPPGDAAALADVIEQLADATPEEHRELAAAIRHACADADGSRDKLTADSRTAASDG